MPLGLPHIEQIETLKQLDGGKFRPLRQKAEDGAPSVRPTSGGYAPTADTEPTAAQLVPLHINAADIAPRSVPWLISSFIVRGALNGVRGLPNSGKSWITCALACAVADGGKWYNEYGEFSDVPQGRVLIANFDDDASYTIIPRLRDCGITDTGIRNISILDRAACVDLNFNDERLAAIFEQTKPDLAIFDTLQHFLGAKADMNRANEMNAALVSLQRLAEKYDTAVILVEHINKAAANGNAGHSLNWGLGSTAIPGLMRAAWTIGELRDDTHEAGTKAIVCSKYNLMKSVPPARLFQIKGEYGGLVWCGVDDDISAFDLIKPDNKRERGRPADQAERAEYIIINTLRENGGEMLSDELRKIVCNSGISERTYKTVKSSMGIPSFQRGRKWYVTMQKSLDNELLHSDSENELLHSDDKRHKVVQSRLNTGFGEF